MNPTISKTTAHLNEGGLNRLMHHGRHGMIIISANRSEIQSSNPNADLSKEYENYLGVTRQQNDEETAAKFLKERNQKAEASLLNDIKRAGYAYSKVFGGYHGGDDVTDSYEPSFVVYNHAPSHSNDYRNWESLKKFAIEMCAKYKQDSVYVQAPGEAPVYLDAQGNQANSSSSNNFKFNRDQEMFYTTTKRDKSNPQRFTADINFEAVIREGCIRTVNNPCDYEEGKRRRKSGEVFLLSDY